MLWNHKFLALMCCIFFSSLEAVPTAEGLKRAKEEEIRHLNRQEQFHQNLEGGYSSYQGTTTGPGPNGGYPGTPRGNYRTTYKQQTENL